MQEPVRRLSLLVHDRKSALQTDKGAMHRLCARQTPTKVTAVDCSAKVDSYLFQQKQALAVTAGRLPGHRSQTERNLQEALAHVEARLP